MDRMDIDYEFSEPVFEAIPRDTLIIIFSHILFETSDYFILSQVCRKWRDLSRSDECCAVAIKEQLTDENDVASPLFNTIQSFFIELMRDKPDQEDVQAMCSSGFEKLFVRYMEGQLIEWEENAEIKHSFFFTACESKKLGIVKFLLNYIKGADAQNSIGSALHYAACFGRSELIELLTRLKINPNYKSEHGTSSLALAIQGGHVETVKLLLQNEGADGETLIEAVRAGEPEIVKLLLDKKLDPNYQDAEGCTPLYVACDEDNLEIVTLLLKYNANVNIASNEYKETPLTNATSKGNYEIVKILLQSNANINHTTSDGWNCLLIACLEGHLDIVQLAVQNNANVNQVRTFDGYSPLHYASLKSRTDVVQFLLEHHADVNHVNVYGKTSEDIARKPEIIALLQQQKSKI